MVALGVGIGVDYGIYIFARLQSSLRAGAYFEDAMYDALKDAGAAVMFTGFTLAIGVSTWVWSELVPSRHGHPAHVHVPREHGGCNRAPSRHGALVLASPFVDAATDADSDRMSGPKASPGNLRQLWRGNSPQGAGVPGMRGG
jgi:hypothetical protein